MTLLGAQDWQSRTAGDQNPAIVFATHFLGESSIKWEWNPPNHFVSAGPLRVVAYYDQQRLLRA